VPTAEEPRTFFGVKGGGSLRRGGWAARLRETEETTLCTHVKCSMWAVVVASLSHSSPGTEASIAKKEADVWCWFRLVVSGFGTLRYAAGRNHVNVPKDSCQSWYKNPPESVLPPRRLSLFLYGDLFVLQKLVLFKMKHDTHTHTHTTHVQ